MASACQLSLTESVVGPTYSPAAAPISPVRSAAYPRGALWPLADNTTNPYLAQLGLLAAGFDGIEREVDPGKPLNRDPDGVDDGDLEARGIQRLPESLSEALDAFEADDVLADALGEPLHGSFLEVKRSECAQSTEDGDTDYLARSF